MADTEAELPEFVVDGSFEDHEWRAAAAKQAFQRSKAEERIYQSGPRQHPYGNKAALEKDSEGTARWFPDRATKDMYARKAGRSAMGAPEAEAAASEGNPIQAKAEATAREKTPSPTKPKVA